MCIKRKDFDRTRLHFTYWFDYLSAVFRHKLAKALCLKKTCHHDLKNCSYCAENQLHDDLEQPAE